MSEQYNQKGSEIVKEIILRGDEAFEFPLVKKDLDDAWLCRLEKGSVSCVFNFEEYNIAVSESEKICFVIHDGCSFSLRSGSCDFVLRIIRISKCCLTTLYSYLGSEANAGLAWFKLQSSKSMRKELEDMLSRAYEQLVLLIHACNILQYDKLVLHLLIHIYLLFFNGTNSSTAKSSRQSFELINRFYELCQTSEAQLHRDTAYYAGKLNVSVRYLFQICKNETGRSPKELINEAVVSSIQHLILTTNLSFNQISQRFAFADQTAFTQFFKRNSNMTPSEFKKKYK